MRQEKNQPCELIVYAEKFTTTSAAQAADIDSVLQTTLVYAVPAKLTVDQFCIDTTLYGISGSYLDMEADKGSLFSENSGMPYLFLNEKALEELMASGKNVQNPFSQNNQYENMEAEPKKAILSYDWFNASVTVTVSEEQSVISKICGINTSSSRTSAQNEPEGILSIMSGKGASAEQEPEEEEAACYISINAAKNLLLNSGTIPSSTEMRIRITNSGQEGAVTEQLENMGFSVANSNSERLKTWEQTEENIFNTIFTGVVALLAAIALLKGKLDLDLAVHGEEYRHLQHIFDTLSNQKNNLILRIHLIRILALLILSIFLSAVLFWCIPLLFQT